MVTNPGGGGVLGPDAPRNGYASTRNLYGVLHTPWLEADDDDDDIEQLLGPGRARSAAATAVCA